MDRWDLLRSTLATALDMPRGTVDARWDVIRKAKPPVVNRVGRGRVQPDPTGDDGAAFLLGLMGGGLAMEAAETVRMLGSSIRQDASLFSMGDETPFPIAGISSEDYRKLRSMLASMLTHLSGGGELRIDPAALATRVEGFGRGRDIEAWPLEDRGRLARCDFMVSRGPLGWNAVFTFEALVFSDARARHPTAFDVYWREHYTKPRAAPANVASDRTTSETITIRTLTAVAAALRGDAAAVGAAWNCDGPVRRTQKTSRRRRR